MRLPTASGHRAAILATLGFATLGFALAVTACASSRTAGAAPRPAPADSALAHAFDRESVVGGAGRTGVRGNPIGVMPFTVTAAPSDPTLAALRYALADLLTTDLARSRRLTLVERTRLGDVLRELDLAGTKRVDSATAPRVGRFLQARRLVLGGVGSVDATSPLAPNGTLRLGVRLADVRTGTVTQAVDATAPLTDVLAAEKVVAFGLFEALGVTLAPDERAAVEQRPTSNLAALLAYGRGAREEYDGQYWRAVAEFRRAVRLDPQFREAADREAEARALAQFGTLDPITVPGLASVDVAVASAVDRLNRPLNPISTLTRPSTAADPSFPITTSTVVVVVTRP